MIHTTALKQEEIMTRGIYNLLLLLLIETVGNVGRLPPCIERA